MSVDMLSVEVSEEEEGRSGREGYMARDTQVVRAFLPVELVFPTRGGR